MLNDERDPAYSHVIDPVSAHHTQPPQQIFKATYSSVPVLEMLTAGIPLMRRRKDGWLNATQILKVAGFDKPQRTRILERDIQKGAHEKVQGGFGKYQGTWVPAERGLDIARQYHCEDAIRPIVDFVPHIHGSPPLAPKHLSNPPASRRRKNDLVAAFQAHPANGHTITDPDPEEDVPMDFVVDNRSLGSEEGERSSSPSHASSSSRTPSPIGSPRPAPAGPLQSPAPLTRAAKNRASRRSNVENNVSHQPPDQANHHANPAVTPRQRQYAQEILDYFVSDSTTEPQLLLNPPHDFDANIAIDDDGHTAIHWACAMGRVRIVKLLISHGADMFRVNRNGQTCLMRAVMFANNYDVRKFPELFQLLHRTTLNIDYFNRTVFHHCVDLAMTKGKSHAARYYMETMLNHLRGYPSELADIINWRDDEGETALTMAARCRSKRLVKLLLDHDADPKIKNAESKSAEMYLVDDEQFRASPTIAPRPYALSYRASQALHAPLLNGTSGLPLVQPPELQPRTSVAATRAQNRCVNDAAAMLDALAASFDAEIEAKDKEIFHCRGMIEAVERQKKEGTGRITLLRADTDRLETVREQLQMLQQQFARTMAQRHRRGWERWIRDEERRDVLARELGLIAGLGAGVPASEAAETTGTKRRRPDEDLSDLVKLHANLPESDEEVRRACADLREEIMEQRKRRRTAFNELVTLQAETGTGTRISDYRQLLKLAVPNTPLEEIEASLPLVLESLESEAAATIPVVIAATK
ncbi:transcription factor [Auriculariales sp. MPI-PUGE-AT-0066]|nr:transcription factor [Auriculariales sp. MPI-PUGE-AT-0066]